MKKFLTCAFLFFCIPVWAGNGVVNIFTWSGFISDSAIQQFEKETGIKVNISEFDNNETLFAKLKATSGQGYDLIFPSNYFIERLAKSGLLETLDKSKMPNIKYLDKRFLNLKTDPQNQYSLPFMWCSIGIGINKKYIDPKSVKRFSDLWLPRFKNKLLILDEQRDMFSVVLIALGYSVNDTNPEHMKEAYQKMLTLLPNIKLFNSMAVANIFIDEDIHIGVSWSGEISVAQEENPNIVYIYPEDGFVIELDCVAMTKNAVNKENAYKLLNFLMRPDVAVQSMLEFRYIAPIPEAIKLLPKHLREDPTLNPSDDLFKKGQFQNNIGDANAILENYWERLKVKS